MQATSDFGVEPTRDLRPNAVLSVGIVGHRSIGISGEAAGRALESLSRLFQGLAGGVQTIAGSNGRFLALEPAPKVRLIGMMADGADLLAAQAALAAGAELVCVLPYATNEYRKDFNSPASLDLAMSLISGAASRLELPGARVEGARAYERASDVILSNADLLIAVWDRERASGRAGTGDVVETALGQRIPIILVDPRQPEPPTLLVRQAEDFGRLNASELEPQPLDLAPLIAKALLPPPGATRRQGYLDFLVERPHAFAWRPEYALLLRLLSPAPSIAARPGDAAPSIGQQTVRDPAFEARSARSDRIRQSIDELAAHYGRLRRSSLVSRYFLLIIVACVSGLIGILVPALSGGSIVVQLVANGLVALDSTAARWRRWRERWMDYRSLAERLRVLRFLQPFGLARPAEPRVVRGARPSWTDWYLTRNARTLGLPDVVVGPTLLAATARALAENEIPEQIAYHRRTFRQLGVLERRLWSSSNLAIVASVIVASCLLIAKNWGEGSEDIGWAPVANLMLAILPAAMNAVQGIRSEADLIRLVERSATTAAALVRLRRSVLVPPLTYDRVACALAQASTLMVDELAEWRFVNESRRSRYKRRRALRRVFWKRLLRLGRPQRGGLAA